MWVPILIARSMRDRVGDHRAYSGYLLLAVSPPQRPHHSTLSCHGEEGNRPTRNRLFVSITMSPLSAFPPPLKVPTPLADRAILTLLRVHLHDFALRQSSSRGSRRQEARGSSGIRLTGSLLRTPRRRFRASHR